MSSASASFAKAGSTESLMDLLDDEAGAPPAESTPPRSRGKLAPPKRRATEPAAIGREEDEEPATKKVKEEVDDEGVPPSGPLTTPRKNNKAPSGSAASPSHSDGGSPSGCHKKAGEGCAGCGRIHGVSPCFLVVGETCAWAFANGRGQWCKECYRVHDSNWKMTHALQYFPQWLRERDNRIAWEETLLADLSLRWEGFSRVSGDMVTKRVGVLKWLWSITGTDPLRSAGTEGFIREWVAQLSGAPPVSNGSTEVKAEEVGETPAKKKSSLGKTLDGLIPKARDLLKALAKDSWVDGITDGQLTKLCERLAGCYAQCGAIGESVEVTELAAKWSDGTQAAKQFLKAFCLRGIWVDGEQA